MKELIYQVEFLSDIVLPASSNTEGNISQLDFIPGSNFLGMVAAKYDQFEDSFKVFHSGKVKFSDANIVKNNKQTYKMPFSYFHEKLDPKVIYNHHKIDDFKKFKQLKQKRNGYVTSDLEEVSVKYNYSQKSAYDKEKRRSKDSQMFGYNAIASGTTWQFSIKCDDISDNDLRLLKKSIEGKKRLGKSKSAQYGLVYIESKGEKEEIEDKNSQELVLYANSRLALVDEMGNPTYDLKYLFEGLNDDNIDYAKCQIRTSTFTPYNGVRQTKDYERICINKGSVIVLKDVDKTKIPSFVGAYQSEGFGELLLNPKFLANHGFSFKEHKNVDVDIEKVTPKSDLAKFLQQRQESKQANLDLGKKVAEFIKEHKTLYKNIQPSQWGKIRSICTSAQADFKNQINEYISHGTKKWESKQIKTLIKDEHSLEFIKLISIQMPKIKANKEQKNG